jgi:hypothetical protein
MELIHMSARTLSFIVLGAGLTLGMAACGDQPTTKPAAAPAPTATAPAPAPATSAPAPGNAGSAPESCPDSATLIAARERETGRKMPKGTVVDHIECHAGFAISTVDTKLADREVEVFKYESGAWKSFTGGTGDYCKGLPADVMKHFRGKNYPGCA